MIFLTVVFVVLISLVFLIGWISKIFIFERLEPAFVGALVGAAGTIFAACIAYTAASQNLEMAQTAATTAAQQRIQYESLAKTAAKEQARRELQVMRELLAFCDRHIALFDGAAETGPRDYFAYMVDVLRDGTFVQYLMGAPAPLGTKAHEVFQSFFNVRVSVEQAKNRVFASDQPVPERADLNRAIRDRLGDVKRLRSQVDDDIRQRERAVDAMADR